MAKNKKRERKSGFGRKENIREEKKGTKVRSLLTFSFKDLDQSQPTVSPQTIQSWMNDRMLAPLIERLRDLSKLTRDEALKQQQIKIYGNFPPVGKTMYKHPSHVEDNVAWSVIKAIGGQKGTVAGYVIESTFYIVFFDKDHKFWISEKKHT
jgi:hypothetical protein